MDWELRSVAARSKDESLSQNIVARIVREKIESMYFSLMYTSSKVFNNSFFNPGSTLFCFIIVGDLELSFADVPDGRNRADAHCGSSHDSRIDTAVLAGTTSPPSVQYASAETASRRSWTNMARAAR